MLVCEHDSKFGASFVRGVGLLLMAQFATIAAQMVLTFFGQFDTGMAAHFERLASHRKMIQQLPLSGIQVVPV